MCLWPDVATPCVPGPLTLCQEAPPTPPSLPACDWPSPAAPYLGTNSAWESFTRLFREPDVSWNYRMFGSERIPDVSAPLCPSQEGKSRPGRARCENSHEDWGPPQDENLFLTLPIPEHSSSVAPTFYPPFLGPLVTHNVCLLSF